MSDDTTTPKTLWSETQFEVLYSAIQKKGPDREIVEIVKDLKERGFPPKYLVEKVQDKVGMTSANRLKGIIRDANL
ncbi:MAG: hypothetical protein R3174_09340 [Gammaproteobacteria bacterium]|nr:hypothetical protein [Gammaproteobacteria bacterium]